jgi:hypothetical protein
MPLQYLIESLLSRESELEKNILLSIQALETDVLIKAKFYEGDLLMTVLAVKEDFWKKYPVYWNQIVEILDIQSDTIKNQQVSFEMKREWYEKIERFKGIKF